MSGLSEELPMGWEITNGNSLFEFVRGVSYKKEDASELAGKGTVAILRAGNLQAGEILLDDLVYVPKNYVRDEQRVRQGDLIIAMSSGSASVVGKVSVAIHDMPDVSFGTFCGLLRPRSSMLKHWLSEYFQTRSYRSFISELAAGVNINNLRREHLLELQIPVPPKREMQRVERKIEALQERSRRAREALAEVKPLLEQFRQSVLAAAFRGDLTADWREQNPDVEPASELLKRIRTERRKKWEAAELARYAAKNKQPPKGWQDKYQEPEPVDDSELPELPEGWCWSVIEDVCSEIVDCPHSTPKWADDGKPCVRTTEFRAGCLDLKKVRFVSIQTFEERVARLRPEPGDVLYSREGGILGIACQIPQETELCLGQRMMLMRPVSQFAASLLMHWLNSPYIFLGRVQSKIQGAASPHINVGEVKRFPIPVPPIEEQAKICHLIKEGMEAIEIIGQQQKASVADLTQLDQSILAKAFRGELVPQDPNDEPASVLLERIRQQRENAPAVGRRKRKTAAEVETAHEDPTRRKRLEKGQIVLNLLLLLEAWEKPVSIIPLENALGLMERPDMSKSLGRAGALAANAHKNASTVIYPQMDLIYANLVAKKIIRLVGKHAYELIDHSRIAGAAATQRKAARDAISSLMELMKRQQLDDAGTRRLIASQLGQPYDLQTTGSGSR